MLLCERRWRADYFTRANTLHEQSLWHAEDHWLARARHPSFTEYFRLMQAIFMWVIIFSDSLQRWHKSPAHSGQVGQRPFSKPTLKEARIGIDAIRPVFAR